MPKRLDLTKIADVDIINERNRRKKITQEQRTESAIHAVKSVTRVECLLLWELSHRLFAEVKAETDSVIREVKERHAFRFDTIRERLVVAREELTGELLSYTQDGEVKVRMREE